MPKYLRELIEPCKVADQCISTYIHDDVLTALRGSNVDVVFMKQLNGLPWGLLPKEYVNLLNSKQCNKQIIQELLMKFIVQEFEILSANIVVNAEVVLSLRNNHVIAVNEDQYPLGTTTKAELAIATLQETTCFLDHLEALLDSAHNGIIAIDENGIITTFNKAAENIIHVTKEKAVGKPCLDWVPLSGLPRVLNTGQAEYGQKQQIGRKKIILVNRSPIIHNSKITGAVAIFQDISDLETISKELTTVKNLNSELNGVIESSSDGILITDSEGIIIRANHAFSKVLGIEAGGMVTGQHITCTFQPDHPLYSVINHVIEKQVTASTLVKTSEGKQLLTTANPMKTEEGEKVSRVIVTIRDLTELNQLRMELERTQQLSEQYRREIEMLRGQYSGSGELVARSPQMVKVMELASRAAQVDATVLITGESGVGKEVVAKYIHNHSPRKDQPFVRVNCGSIPEALLESELFGYEPGAFTGASKEGKVGLFEQANKGTILLDEIGELPLSMQVKLLRVLQDKEIVRVGGSKTKKLDVRIMAATNRNLQEMISKGQFREDLFYRLHVIPIDVPALRDRKKDIIPLVQCFAEELGKKYHVVKEFSSEVIYAFLAYPWPGNVRELQNLIEQLFVLLPEQTIMLKHLPPYFWSGQPATEKLMPSSETEVKERDTAGFLKSASLSVEKQLIEEAIRKCGNMSRAAKMLGVSPSTISRKLRKLEIWEKQQH